MSASVAVIGAGNVGSRHLQALARLPTPVRVHVVDPSSASLALARQRYEAMVAESAPNVVSYLHSVDDLPTEVDVAIVATTADMRARATTALVEGRQVRYLVLEKILFQRLADYEVMATLLQRLRLPTWVNIPRRQYEAYRPIKEALAGADWIDYRASGSSWGLGCNAIHFIDHVAHLTGEARVSVDASGLDPGTVPARRPGFREFTGRLVGRCGRATFALTSMCAGQLPVQLCIESDVARFVIAEEASALHLWTATPGSGWLLQPSTAARPLQSQLTERVVTELLQHGTCPLTPYHQAAEMHVALIQSLLAHLQASGHATDVCPIT